MIKLPDTLQEVFDIVSKHLLTQVKRSRNKIGGQTGCAYRGDNGLKCAAGILIPDDQYDPNFEGLFWNDLVKNKFVENKFKLEIVKLQMIHDCNTDDSSDYLKKCLIEFAQNNHLICNFEV